MKHFLFNFLGFIILTAGAGAAYYSIQTHAVSAGADLHAGHAHADNKHQETTIIPPDERDPKRLWCREHAVYEDECVLCHPELAARAEHEGHDHASHAGEGHVQTAKGLFCAEHQLLETNCGICQPQLAQQLKPGEGIMVRLPSKHAREKAGIQTGKPEIGSIDTSQSHLCEVLFDQNRISHISPLAKGVIEKVHVKLGEEVKAGQVLVEVASTDVAHAKSAYLKALDQEKLKKIVYHRDKELHEKKIGSQQDFQQAEAEYQVAQTETMSSRQQLLNYGLTKADIENMRAQRSTTSTLPVRAPFAGTVVEKHAVQGEAVNVGESIVTLIDRSNMWLMISIPEAEMAHVNLGDPIRAGFSMLPETTVEGKITWISPQINKKTRMLQVRAEVNNPNQKLKQGMFGNASFVQPSQNHLLVPKDVVQSVEGKPFVFIQTEDDLFELRHITTGKQSPRHIEVHQGLSPNEEIAVKGAFVLKSELLKSRFGAGCAHD